MRGRPRKELTDQQVNAVLGSTIPLSDLAREWGISYNTLHARMRDLFPDFSSYRRWQCGSFESRLKSLRRQGFSTHKIGRMLKVSQTWAWMELRRLEREVENERQT